MANLCSYQRTIISKRAEKQKKQKDAEALTHNISYWMIFDEREQPIKFSCLVTIYKWVQQIIPHNIKGWLLMALFHQAIPQRWASVVWEPKISRWFTFMLHLSARDHDLVNHGIRLKQCPPPIKQFWDEYIATDFGRTLKLREMGTCSYQH